MLEKITRLALGLLIAVLVPRYLGPEKFGVLAYATSLVGVFASIVHMGLSGLVVREIVSEPESVDEILGTTFTLKSVGVVVSLFAFWLTVYFTEPIGSVTFWVLIISSLYLLFQPFQSLDFWFQSQVKSKYITLAQLSGLLIASVVKVLLVVVGSDLFPFSFANLIQGVSVTLFMTILYQIQSGKSYRTWSFSTDRAKILLRKGWLIFLGSIFAVVYLKVDQIMLKWMSGSEVVGIYSAAATLSEVWYFVPGAIVLSLFPKLIKLRESSASLYTVRLQQIFDLLFVLAFSIAILITLFARPLVSLSYGPAYLESASILIVHVWAGLFIFMRAAFSKWILMENALTFSMITQGLGAFANVALNWVLIPRFGGYGAAISTIISYAAASYLSLLLYPKTREIFWMMTRSIGLVPTLGMRYWHKLSL